MNEQQNIKEPIVNEELDKMIELLKGHETILRYQRMEKVVAQNSTLEKLVEDIKKKQKEAAAFEYYAKPLAAKKIADELAALNRQLKENITVQQYRDALWDANEILENTVVIIQNEVDAVTNKEDTGSNK
ncbi:Hypothetical protein Tpal_433 [Trichococcus palustris]|uniref:Control of competence regulator comk ylbf/ymca n=1 Tax=Trichococcus palustris TaxID=140314 RepID=A0A143YA17_9LACT|nr:YlbF family regulator [Trichococcus palustris]CZQ83341.1 Hypothetical protein Tpal_433 [Trichococcus palustris]SFK69613.1 Control of competence regulator ComK, YlbF/YmcA [Trichococcus palustris]